MAIIKDVTVKINNGTATLDAPVQFYEKDHDVELRFKLMDYKYKYDKDPQNILNSVDEDVLEAYTTIVNPRGYELEQINGVIKNDTVIFRLDPTYTDELDELGTYKLQIHIKCTHSEFTIPPITFEVLQRLKGIKVVTDGDDEVDNSEILDNSSKFVSDETGKLIIEWKKGDMISSAKLNAMVDVINDAVDEEVIRQANEINREIEANNKIQELENTRIEYINKIDDQVDISMSDYETRFNALTVSQQQDAEVIDARDGEQTLKARLDRDIQKPSIIYEEVEDSHINVDTTCGYASDIEILGNTIQNQNDLADIRSAGDKIEGQELYKIDVVSRGKNLFDISLKSYELLEGTSYDSYKIKLKPNTKYVISIKVLNKTFNLQKYIGLNKNPNTGDDTFKWLYHAELGGYFNGGTLVYTTDELGCIYLSFGYCTTEELNVFLDTVEIQIEEGTVATPYEPYVEDKLTILSPVQLEKVGDVADRIICKDGVWGVEKNVKTVVANGTENITLYQAKTNTIVFKIPYSDLKVEHSINIISNRFVANKNITGVTDVEAICVYSNGNVYVSVSKTKLTTQDVEGFKTWLKNNNLLIKYPINNSQFIPLPHDQQVKLRTFAGQTNIHFETEIEGTIKAQVPKSIGATVNSHTEQIGNLSKELDRVKKLEESTVSTVTTESDFTTVTETANGYFEDVKLEGKTLVNICEDTPFTYSATYPNRPIKNCIMLKPSTEYTFALLGDFANARDILISDGNVTEITLARGNYGQIFTFVTPSNINEFTKEQRIFVYNVQADLTETQVSGWKIVILEGDHTQNPPEYFEGIKSVGQDVDDITIATTNAPMFFGKGGKK